MESKAVKRIQHENKKLKEKLEISRIEINAIKSSRAYKAIRVVGKVRDELRDSPIGFAKKIAEKARGHRLGAALADYHEVANYGEMLQKEYEEWIHLNEPDDITLADQRVISNKFKKRPLISVVTPVFNPPADVFTELIESVLAQTYENFELCLGNFGDNKDILKILEHYAKQDARIRVWNFEKNEGIAGNSNQILKKVKGDYIALLDHDDTISPDALYENVKMLNIGEYDFIYSDKDKIDENGKRFDVFFKPDWSPEMMMSANYLTHLNLMNTKIVKKVGGWSSHTDGAQDWDLFLKVISATKHPIGHISKVLYHWRVIPTSTALSIETKPYALEGQRNAMKDYLKHIEVKAEPYHVGAELLLRWPNYSKKIVSIIFSDSYTDTSRVISYQRPYTKKTVVLGSYRLDGRHFDENVTYLQIDGDDSSSAMSELKERVKELAPSDVVLISDGKTWITEKETISSLAGWIGVKGVVGASPMVKHGSNIIDCGAVYQEGSLEGVFQQPLPYLQTPLGNIEWVRNLNVVTSSLLVTNGSNFKAWVGDSLGEKIDPNLAIILLQAYLRRHGRLVFDPKRHAETTKSLVFKEIIGLPQGLQLRDEYSNDNVDCLEQVRIRSVPRGKEVEEDDDLDDDNIDVTYQGDALAHAYSANLSNSEFKKNIETIKANNKQSLHEINTATFFLPGFTAIYAGLNNIFSFIVFLQEHKHVKVTVAVLAPARNISDYREIVLKKFPELSKVKFVHVDEKSAGLLPESDIAVCTQWATAYLLAKYNKTRRKCYFIQDKESSFYPKGTISALAEFTYRFGFTALANTPGLLASYKKEYDGDGFVVRSHINLESYKPTTHKQFEKPYKVFFYGRPAEPRNAFELGVQAFQLLKKRYGRDIDIYSAGAEWDVRDYGLEHVVRNVGKVPYDQLPDFYRSMDVGVMFMFSGHPGVVASELMASGCPVVVNEYDDETWNDLYQNEKTCLVSYPTAQSVADAISRLLEDDELRKRVIRGGLEKATSFYAGYQISLEDSFEEIKRAR